MSAAKRSVIIFLLLVSTALGQEIEKAFVVKHSGSKQQFKEAFQRLINPIKGKDAIQGRAIFQTYPIQQWSVISGESDGSPVKPLSIAICDFVSDFAELRDRQDWTILKVPDKAVEIESLYSLDELPLFQAWKGELLDKHFMLAKTVDRSFYRSGSGNVRMGLPTELWEKTIYDFRLLGWCVDGQWRLPTSFEQWLKILEFGEPYAIEKDADSTTVRLTFFMNQRNQSIWVLEIDVGPEFRLKTVRNCRVVDSKADELVVLPKSLFESQFEYKNSMLSRVRTTNLNRNEVIEVRFLYTGKMEAADKYFEPDLFLQNNASLEITPPLQSVLEFQLQKK